MVQDKHTHPHPIIVTSIEVNIFFLINQLKSRCSFIDGCLKIGSK
uniref:Uncharacterized protein n=1 Tax=Nelumbo nucifera TaxID=4432 RepID=A0A822XUM1_NELNU|nr:TPA_asm: hypothetical protein HUJ06_024334 [Nelumbo nucifera]